jgi:hypothetical protein
VASVYATVDVNRGIRLEWTAVDVIDLDHYSIIGAGIGGTIGNGVPNTDDEAVATKTMDTFLWIMPYGANSGELTYGVYAVDTSGNMSPTMTTVTAGVVPPKKPKPVFTDTAEGGVITWEDCTSLWEISHYIVEDVHNDNYTHEIVDRYIALTPRKAGEDYDFNITAVDIYGNRSETANVGFTVDEPSAPVATAYIKDDAIAITWAASESIYQIDRYVIYDVDNLTTELGSVKGSVKGTEFVVPAPINVNAGTSTIRNYRVFAIDIAGNVSAGADCSITINPPASPTNVVATKNGGVLDITWDPSVSDITVTGYRVEHSATDSTGKTIIPTYTIGTFDTTFVSIPAVIVGEHTFNVYAINKCGTESIIIPDDDGKKQLCTFTSVAPPPVIFEDCSPVDNNVMMRYTVDAEKVFWPIKEYQVFEVVEEGKDPEALIGRTDTHFFADIKMMGGVYIYGIKTIDVAGNISVRTDRKVTVNQPPNFVLFRDADSTFNGKKTNMLMDGVGGMYGPIEYDDTWATNVSRVASLVGKTAAKVTWKDKINNNMPFFFSPESSSEGLVGSYQEVIDVGTVVPSSSIIVTVSSKKLSESEPIMTQKIETSTDNKTWSEVDTTGKALSKNFQYVRVTLSWTGGLVYVDNIHFQVSSSEINDVGSVVFTATDYMKDDPKVDSTDTEPIGKVVYFNKPFVDIIAFTGLTVRGSERKTAYIIFKDNARQQWFRVFILDKDGNRTSGQVDWAVKGV